MEQERSERSYYITDENVQCEINLTYEKFGDVYKDGDSSIKLSC